MQGAIAAVIPAPTKKAPAAKPGGEHSATAVGGTAPVLQTSVAAPAILAQATAQPAASAPTENVVVTGSLIRNPNFQSASPITHLTSRDLRARGITTASAALQQLAANGSGTLPPSFSANGAFAAGASAPSLRGLTTDSTLVLMDGQRLAYYPLSDDGERNFVDTNWIPMSIMQAIDVEKDGASATYGADAVAGVINFITRKEVKGFEGNAEGGLSELGDSGHQRLYATYGHGDLARDNYNFYINAEYQNDDMLYNRQRGYPYNTGVNLGYTNGATLVTDGLDLSLDANIPLPGSAVENSLVQQGRGDIRLPLQRHLSGRGYGTFRGHAGSGKHDIGFGHAALARELGEHLQL
jgi:iron complex outermembrane recepter protein